MIRYRLQMLMTAVVYAVLACSVPAGAQPKAEFADQQEKRCSIPATFLRAGVKLLLLFDASEGQVSNVSAAHRRPDGGVEFRLSTVSNIVVEGGNEPINIVIFSDEYKIIRFSGATDRVNRIHIFYPEYKIRDEIDNEAVVIGVDRSKISFSLRLGCLQWPFDAAQLQKQLDIAAGILGRRPDRSALQRGNQAIAVPSFQAVPVPPAARWVPKSKAGQDTWAFWAQSSQNLPTLARFSAVDLIGWSQYRVEDSFPGAFAMLDLIDRGDAVPLRGQGLVFLNLGDGQKIAISGDYREIKLGPSQSFEMVQDIVGFRIVRPVKIPVADSSGDIPPFPLFFDKEEFAPAEHPEVGCFFQSETQRPIKGNKTPDMCRLIAGFPRQSAQLPVFWP